MRDKLLGTFDSSIHIEELRSYYSKVVTDYQHLKWSFDIGGNDIIDLWRNIMLAEPSTLLPYGWAIQSNIEDLSKPCPPYNITSHRRIGYRNTELVFGPIIKLQESYPNAYRYSISVLPPNSKVTLHSDQEDELTVWIPIYSNNEASITFVEDDIEYPIICNDTGLGYIFDTTIPHYTINNGNSDRVAIIYRFNKKFLHEFSIHTH